MASYSGKSGKVEIGATQVAHITGWTLTETSNNPAYASSETGGAKTRVMGVKDATGSMQGKLDDTTSQDATIKAGSSGTAKLYTDSSKYIEVDIIIDRFEVEVDPDEGEIVSFSADFSATAAVDYSNL